MRLSGRLLYRTALEVESSIVITSVERGARLTFSDLVPESDPNFYTFVATVEQPGLRASVKVYDMDGEPDSGRLADFFSALAEEWRGWEGEKEWAALEGQLALSCTSDRTGHARLVARLGEATHWDGWSAETVLTLDVMQRERIAKEVLRFFDRAV